jgi:6-phosphogluconolactonase
MPDTLKLIVGTYAEGGGKGLYPLGYDRAADRWTLGEPDTAITDASFGVAEGERHWLVHETEPGRVVAYRPAAEGLKQLAETETGCAEPCCAALDSSGRWLAVANYKSGSLAVVRLEEDGHPGAVQVIESSGSGPDGERQEGPHVHWVGWAPDRAHLFATDLGADAILSLRFDAAHGVIGDVHRGYSAPAGSGPRWLVFHPRLPIAYLVSELASTLTVLAMSETGGFAATAVMRTLPANFAGESLGGHLLLNADATRLYVTNRGHDSVAVFALDEAGTATLLEVVPSAGQSPRFLALFEDERRLLVAHEEGGGVVPFAIGEDGRLERAGEAIDVPGAVYIGRLA